MMLMNFQEIEDLMYLAKLQLYWKDEESYMTIDWRDAKVIAFTMTSVTLKNTDGEERSWSLEEFSELVHTLTDKHSEEFTEACKKLKEEGVIK